MPKRFYAYLRWPPSATADVPLLELNGALAETDVDKAEAFAQHCASVYATDASPTHPPPLSCSAPLPSWQAISVNKVCDALPALKPY
ncbi:unnamed protein product [Echinostoma caproni]|uniref:DUF1330 domain-containing protein n=1 Tax=Echinostoma caproni TaxID=27848 RepID=A0A183BH03_9TREM|nr:unnamed protein product [Echinostoma caproni]